NNTKTKQNSVMSIFEQYDLVVGTEEEDYPLMIYNPEAHPSGQHFVVLPPEIQHLWGPLWIGLELEQNLPDEFMLDYDYDGSGVASIRPGIAELFPTIQGIDGHGLLVGLATNAVGRMTIIARGSVEDVNSEACVACKYLRFK